MLRIIRMKYLVKGTEERLAPLSCAYLNRALEAVLEIAKMLDHQMAPKRLL